MTTGTTTFEATPVISLIAYSIGDVVGTKMTFDTGGLRLSSPFITSVGLVDQNKLGLSMHLVVFDQDPTLTTITDNGVLDVADADMSKIAAIVPITTYSSFNDNSFGYARDLNYSLSLRSSFLYCVLVTQATGTFAAVTDITLLLNLTAY